MRISSTHPWDRTTSPIRTHRQEVCARAPVDRTDTAPVELDEPHAIGRGRGALLPRGRVGRPDEAGEVEVCREVCGNGRLAPRGCVRVDVGEERGRLEDLGAFLGGLV